MSNYDLWLLKQADEHLSKNSTPEDLTIEEMVKEIADENGIDVKDWFGKYLVLQLILNSMGNKEADKFLKDTFDVLEDEIKNLYEREVKNEQVA